MSGCQKRNKLYIDPYYRYKRKTQDLIFTLSHHCDSVVSLIKIIQDLFFRNGANKGCVLALACSKRNFGQGSKDQILEGEMINTVFVDSSLR